MTQSISAAIDLDQISYLKAGIPERRIDGMAERFIRHDERRPADTLFFEYEAGWKWQPDLLILTLVEGKPASRQTQCAAATVSEPGNGCLDLLILRNVDLPVFGRRRGTTTPRSLRAPAEAGSALKDPSQRH